MSKEPQIKVELIFFICNIMDAGIITNWKVKYKKRLLHYICGQFDGSKSASDIVKSVNLLMSTIQRCFQKKGLYPEEIAIEDDPFEGDELQDLQELLNNVEVPCSAEEYMSIEDDLEVCSGYVDTSDPNWRELVRDELVGDNLSVFTTNSDTASSVSDDEYDGDVQKTEINSLTEAIDHAEHLRHFALYNGYEELALSISKTNDLLCALEGWFHIG